ncbi:hypothetical protein TNCV_1793431 [Trichonephila clavipes]|nr:hypothetical protein TNCV_1793431 [Trichonephila clavipes]
MLIRGVLELLEKKERDELVAIINAIDWKSQRVLRLEHAAGLKHRRPCTRSRVDERCDVNIHSLIHTVTHRLTRAPRRLSRERDEALLAQALRRPCSGTFHGVTSRFQTD